MKKNRAFSAAVSGVLLGSYLATGVAIELPEVTDPTIQGCIDKSMPENSLTQRVTLTSFDDSGVIEEMAGSVYWRRNDEGLSDAVIRLSAPASRAGLAVLMRENKSAKSKLYLYVPDLKRTRTVTGKQVATSMMGTDFSYEEFSYLQNVSSDSTTTRVDDGAVDGEAAYVFETVPGDPEAAYSKIMTYVDQAMCVPMLTQFFSGDSVAKELITTRDSVEKIDGRFVPHQVVMHDRVKNTRTELAIKDVVIDPGLDDGLFHPKRLGMAP